MFKVIIVDDEYDICQGLKRLISWEEQGYQIVGEAEDGLQALEVFHKERPHLVITDIKMPLMDGIELIKEIKHVDPNVKTIIISGYNDFSYAKEAIRYGVKNYLLKPVDSNELCMELADIKDSLMKELSSKIYEKEMLQELKNTLLMKLVRGQVITAGLQETAAQFMADMSYKQFCILLVEIDNYGDFLINLNGVDIQAKMLTIKTNTEEILNEKGQGFVFQNEPNQFCILMTGVRNELDQNNLIDIAQNIVSTIKHYANEAVTIGIGQRVNSISEITISYIQAKKAMERSFFPKQQKVLSYEETASILDMWSLKWNYFNLLQAVNVVDREQVETEIDLLFSELDKSSASQFVSIDVFKTIAVELSRVIVEHDSSWKQLFENELPYLDDILKNGRNIDLKKVLLDVCLKICNFIETWKISENNDGFFNIIKYIDNHYEEEINLKKLSDLFFMNASYLGQLFKKKTGKYFNDYINNVRIQKAKTLLEESKLPIGEISEKVGYKNLDHFYKAFKNITGLNPGGYRKIVLGD